MYQLLIGLELGSLLLLVLTAWIAGTKASHLAYSGTYEQLRRKTGKLMNWTAILTVLAAAAITPIAVMTRTFDPIYWNDRLYLHAPLCALPVIFIWMLSFPKLWKLRKATTGKSGALTEAGLNAEAARPGLILPFQATALGSLTAFYFCFAAPVPFRWLEAVIPLAVLLAATILLWMKHGRRRRTAIRTGQAPVLRHWSIRALQNVGVIGAIGVAVFLLITAAAQTSRLPDRIDMTAGEADYGGGTPLTHDHGGGHAAHAAVQTAAAPSVPVTSLSGPRMEEPDRRITLTAEKKIVTLSSGKQVEAWTYNGQAPGPELRLKKSELAEITLVNKDIDMGVTVHWHGLDVPNAEDGVAGATQDAVMPGETHTYRFRAEQVGTFWYHSHQESKEAVQKGLFGALVVEDDTPQAEAEKDITVITHLWEGTFAIGSTDTLQRTSIAPGTPVRLRLINTDDWVRQAYTLIGASFKVAAIDGTDLHEPGILEDTKLVLTTGGRYDITFVMPDKPVYLKVGEGKSFGLLMSPDGNGSIPASPKQAAEFDPLHYGTPAPVPFGADSKFDRSFTMILDNKLGFFDSRFESLYTINGAVFPNTPMFMVREGELIKTTIVNRGMVDHPMHLHGHHMLVLSRNGERASGSPWWSDTLDVMPGDTYEVAFLANNPGLWMDHCHNLVHAASGMTMHLMYEGVTTPFAVGRETNNHPE
ncbi:multicopper oxidase family protein [Paenibacillus contaminans]|uniref:Multicopper oxidase family protein n=1 Tax=Paenibacillus contaminans TaxID=450362 RepID=A0A329LS88_9BACL|nr:multicopper oxidase family protein [Paenibacillus contaminans]RAV10805.1 multicopper oxidase family protein [Paenibacillus contaminans]